MSTSSRLQAQVKVLTEALQTKELDRAADNLRTELHERQEEHRAELIGLVSDCEVPFSLCRVLTTVPPCFCAPPHLATGC